jgi:dTMP kinase
MDIGLSGDVYESFVRYQTRILEQFDKMTDEFGFTVVDASRSIQEVNHDLKTEIEKFLAVSDESP